MKNFIYKNMPYRILRKIIERKNSFLVRTIKLTSLLNIKECGFDTENDPFIRLRSGEIFYSFLPDEFDKIHYNIFRKYLPKEVEESHFRVAFDIINYFYLENSNEPVRTHFLSNGSGFIDVGSFIGFGSIKAAQKVGSHGKIVSIEAMPQAYRLLKKNVKENNLEKIITPVHSAVSDKNNEINLHTAGYQNNSIFNKIKLYKEAKVKYISSIKVPGRTIDSILCENNYPVDSVYSHVSLEINGAEPVALKGMSNFITQSPRFDMKITAAYSSSMHKNIKKDVLKILSKYPGIIVKSSPARPTIIYAHKF